MAEGLEAARAALRARQGGGARYDAAHAPARELDWARRGTAYFARMLNGLSDAALDEPTRIAGVSRRQMVAHVGYHARLLSEIVAWARSGAASRFPLDATLNAEDIRRQATQPVRALRNLFAHSAVHLNVEWRDLSDAQWDASVQDRAGRPIAIRNTPWRRALAVWLHAIDLGNGGRFDDLPPDFVKALIQDAATQSAPNDDRPFTVVERGDRIEIGDHAGTTVSGRAADIARWLSGRGAKRLQCSGDARPDVLTPPASLIGL